MSRLSLFASALARGLRASALLSAAALAALAASACNRGGAPEPAPTDDAAITATVASPITTTAGASMTVRSEADLLSGARQLVFQGLRSGEGYFSADGRQMIFQSEREADNPFYQIYVLDLDSGETTRVSPGHGKTTCGWLFPDGRQALFASTHDEPSARDEMQAELDFRASGQQRRYSWDYDEAYDLFAVTLGDDDYRNLTNTPGYDAEGAVSPDGTRIVFTSNRRAYEDGAMTDAEREAFERDPSYMADIYAMNADGSDVQRLTDAPGYDGGPFWSPDGERIVWRRFDEEGVIADVWTMNADGSDQRQITDFGAMSWAPFFHPSGDYLVFTSSKEGFDNFELFIVDAEGQHEPVRATFTAGADVLPVFSPDGATLVWSTTRGQAAGAGSQLWTAAWDDARARELLGLTGDAASAGAGDDAVAAAPDMAATDTEIRAEDARLHVEQLASDAMDGRLTGTEGEQAATAYVADAFEAIGLQPAGDAGYFQEFEFTSGVSLSGVNMLAVTTPDGEELSPEVDVDWRPLSFSKVGSAGFGELVFAGYGIVAREDGDQPAYDSYEGLDVAGKWVVVLRYLPEDVDAERRQHLNRYASLRFKAMAARDKGAAGLLVVSGPASQVEEELVPLRFDASVAGTSITAASVRDDVAAPWFEAAGTTLAEAQAALDGGEAVPGFALGGYQAGAHFTLTFDTDTGRNVIGRLQWGEQPSDEVVVVGAHIDHLGRGLAGDTLARPEERGEVHHGADDNASGVAGLVEIAQSLAAADLPEEARDVVFAAWSGEELGLLGSSHWVKGFGEDPDAESIYPAVSAYVNMDMIGRLDDAVILQGIGSSPGWAALVEQHNVAVGLPLTLSDDSYLPTDATSFYLKGVPILAAFTGAHSEYHTPRDTADLIDYEDLARIATLLSGVTTSLATAVEPLSYVRTEAPAQRPATGGLRVYLGTIPDYADTSTAGVLLSGVAENGPAEEAGLQGGDVIVELAGQTIENIYDYTAILDGLKIGEPVGVVVVRDGQRVELTLTPGSRE